MLDWSFNLLSPYEQTVLTRLSIFATHFSVEAALEIALEADDEPAALVSAITGLLDKSLISLSGNHPTHYRLLETTRAYAVAKLANIDKAEVVARRHALYYGRVLQTVDSERKFIRWHDAIIYAAYLDNIRKALSWCFPAAAIVRWASIL
jgi:predicted ATPase